MIQFTLFKDSRFFKVSQNFHSFFKAVRVFYQLLLVNNNSELRAGKSNCVMQDMSLLTGANLRTQADCVGITPTNC